MVKRRRIRALVVSSKMFYFVDRGRQRGLTYDALQLFEKYVNETRKTGKLRRAAAARGLDPNVWFDNVELIAAERIGHETVEYVSNIYKYYIAYKLITEDEEERRKTIRGAEETVTAAPG
jgi:membrane-bound lytic murein transglycosylase MltF